MSRFSLLSLLFTTVAICGCGRTPSKVEMPSWFRSNAGAPGQKATPEQVREQIKAAERKLEKLERSRTANRLILEKCLKEKQEVVAKLKKTGVKSGEDIKADPKLRRYADQLLKLAEEAEFHERVDATFEEAVAQCKALVRRLERSLVVDESPMTEQELSDVLAAIMRLDEKAGLTPGSRPVDPLKLDTILQKELGGK